MSVIPTPSPAVPAKPVAPVVSVLAAKIAAATPAVDPTFQALNVARNFLACAKALVATWPNLDADAQAFVKAQAEFAAVKEL
jgi:hypothetical protein